MKDEIVSLRAFHVREIMAMNLSNGTPPPPVSVDEMIEAYLSKGSAAYCLLIYGEPVVAGGIMNLRWGRGEAWILHSPLFYKHIKTSLRIIRQMLPGLVKMHKFRRVQATSFMNNESLFRHLGFEQEAVLKAYGPDGQNARMYCRIFNGDS